MMFIYRRQQQRQCMMMMLLLILFGNLLLVTKVVVSSDVVVDDVQQQQHVESSSSPEGVVVEGVLVAIDDDADSITEKETTEQGGSGGENASSQRPSSTTKQWGRVGGGSSSSSSSNSDVVNNNNEKNSSNNKEGNAIPFVPPKTPPNVKTKKTATATTSSTTTTTQKPIPIVDHHHHHHPPEGFTVTARVYTDSNDKKAHFSFSSSDSNKEVVLPYWDCGAVGSTTAALPIKDAYFRHALGSVHPNVWSGTEYGPHPQLLIPLKPLELSLNSGSSKIFQPGDVILLEDVMSAGHKLRGAASAPSSSSGGGTVNSGELSALLLTLPQHYHHIGKDRVSLSGNGATSKKNKNGNNKPCPPGVIGGFGSSIPSEVEEEDKKKSIDVMVNIDAVPAFVSRHRKKIFGIAGVGLSSALAFFLIKVTSLKYAAPFGGACLIAGGTYGTIVLGEACTEGLEALLEKRKLGNNGNNNEKESNDEENNNEDVVGGSSGVGGGEQKEQ